MVISMIRMVPGGQQVILLNKGVKLFDKNAHPEFHGDLDKGVYIPLEFDTSIIRIAAFDKDTRPPPAAIRETREEQP